MTKSTKTTAIIAASYFVLFAGIFSYALYLVRAQGAALDETRTTLAERSAKEVTYNSVVRVTENSKANREEIAGYFITERDTVGFIADIERAATQIGVVFTTTELSVTEPQSADGVIIPATLVVGSKFTGTKAAVNKFLTLLENLPYHASIPSVTLSNQSEDGVYAGQAEMIQHIVRRKRGIADPQIMHPMREWVIGIGVTAVVVIAGSVLAATLYNYYDDKRDVIITVSETPVPYNANLVEAALTQYRQKQQQYDQIVGTVIQSVPAPELVEETASSTEAVEEEVPETEIQVPEIIPPATVDSDEVATPDLAI
jgi:hypothetical protein